MRTFDNYFDADRPDTVSGLRVVGDSGVLTDPDDAEMPRIDSLYFDRDDD